MMRDLAEALHRVDLFSELPRDVVSQLAEKLNPQHLDQGEVIFRKGDPGGTMYLIQSGQVAVYVTEDDGSETMLKQLGAGSAIGQITLVDDEPRAASVTAITPVDLLRLGRDDFLEAMSGQPDEVMAGLQNLAARLRLGFHNVLRKLSFFDDLSDELLAETAEMLEVLTLHEGDVLFHKDDPGDSLYIIDRGSVKIVTQDAKGEELVLNRVEAGEAIGEMSLIDQQPRSAGAVALTPTRVLRLSRDNFMSVIRREPVLALEIMENISSRLRFATTYIEQAIEWSKRIAEGDYSFALNQIENSQSGLTERQEVNRAKAAELLTAFFQMIKGVQQREESLRMEVQRLIIQVDENKRKQEYEQVTQSEFFANLKAQAKKLREENESE